MKCVGALAQDEKMRRNTTQTQKNGRNFQYTKFSVIDLVLIDRRTLSVTQWQIFQLSIFVLSREKCHYQSH